MNPDKLNEVYERLESLDDRAVVIAKDLEEHDPAKTHVRARGRCGATEAAVTDCRDSRAEAFERPEASDRLHVIEIDPCFSLHVERDPGTEREPVAESGVRRVLEMRVGVDETGENHCVAVMLSRAELRGRADLNDGAILEGHGSVADRRSLHRNHPVR